MEIKICTKCNKPKSLDNFNKNKKSKDGLNDWCKHCFSDYYYYLRYGKFKEYIHIESDKKQCTKCNKIKLINKFGKNKNTTDGLVCWCKDCTKNYREEHKDEHKIYRKKHKEEFKNYWNIYIKEKLKNDINFKLSFYFSNRMRYSLRGKKQGLKWEVLVNYNLQDLMKHIESQFTQGMSWSNYGEWELDHIIPISSFNITSYDCQDFKDCWVLSNLQPLWKTTQIISGIEYLGNRNKSNLIIKQMEGICVP